MKNYLKNLSLMKRMLLLAGVVGLGLILLSSFSIFLGQPGWTIGIAIGSVIEIGCIALLFFGSNYALKNTSASFFLIFYFLRMVLFIGGFLLAAFLDYYFQIPEFHNSIFGVLIGYTPMQIIICIVMLKEGKNVMNVGEVADEKKADK